MKPEMKRTLLTFFLTAVSAAALAQPGLEECLRKAGSHYPSIKKYGLIESSEAFNLANASRAWLPQVAFSAQATVQSDVVHWPETFEDMLAAQGLKMPGLQKDQYRIQLDLQQSIWDGGKSRSDKRIAESEAEQERRSVDVELYEVESRVEEIYFGILLLQERRRMIGEMTSRLRNNLDYVNALIDNGVAMQDDADAVMVRILSAGQEMTRVQTMERSYRAMLGIFIGEPVGESALLLPSSQMPQNDSPGRPEMLLFDARANLLKAREKAVDVLLMPRISLFAQGYYGYPGLNMFENMMNRDWSLNGIAGVKLSWNIGGFYTAKNNRRLIKDSMAQVEVARDIFTFNNSLQAEQENAEIARIREALDSYGRIVELRTRMRENAEARLREGVLNVKDLLDRISDEADSQIARNTREIELVKALYDLRHTLNN